MKYDRPKKEKIKFLLVHHHHYPCENHQFEKKFKKFLKIKFLILQMKIFLHITYHHILVFSQFTKKKES